MLLCTKELFELPVYRLTKESYYQKFNEYKSKQPSSMSDEYQLGLYGGAWKYNEIIGFLRFYISGNTQIRCVYTETDAKNKVKTRKKIFKERSHSFCTYNINIKSSNQKIIDTIEEAINHCIVNLPKGRFVDRSLFDQTFKHTNWLAVLA